MEDMLRFCAKLDWDRAEGSSARRDETMPRFKMQCKLISAGTPIGAAIVCIMVQRPDRDMNGHLYWSEGTVGEKEAGSPHDRWRLPPIGGSAPCAEHRWNGSGTTTTWRAGPAACHSAAAAAPCFGLKACATFPAAKRQPTRAAANSIPGSSLGRPT